MLYIITFSTKIVRSYLAETGRSLYRFAGDCAVTARRKVGSTKLSFGAKIKHSHRNTKPFHD